VTLDQLGILESLARLVIEESQETPDQQVSLGELVTQAKLVRRVQQACQVLQAVRETSDQLESLVHAATPDQRVKLEPTESLARQALLGAEGSLAIQAQLVIQARQALLAIADELAILVRPETKELRDLMARPGTQDRPATRAKPE
jgi:hypothetical protein